MRRVAPEVTEGDVPREGLVRDDVAAQSLVVVSQHGDVDVVVPGDPTLVSDRSQEGSAINEITDVRVSADLAERVKQLLSDSVRKREISFRCFRSRCVSPSRQLKDTWT